MFIRIALVVRILAGTLRILLLPFLPPQMIYALSVFVSTWALTVILTYLFPRLTLADPHIIDLMA